MIRLLNSITVFSHLGKIILNLLHVRNSHNFFFLSLHTFEVIQTGRLTRTKVTLFWRDKYDMRYK